MKKGFDRIAPLYDLLSRLVFGKSMIKSQLCFIDELKKCNSVLVLGGGTGWWLNDLIKKQPHLKITFVDSSLEMIGLAKAGVVSGHAIHFVHGTIESLSVGEEFDAVVLYYFLDLFPDEQLPDILQKINVHMNAQSLWLVSDFVNKKKWHALLLKLMYSFFYFTTGLNNRSLPPWEQCLRTNGLSEIKEHYFYGKFIRSVVYQ
jgi:tRNA (cmo5U34)-methyltransferase